MKREITVVEFINYLMKTIEENFNYPEEVKASRIKALGTSSDGRFVIETFDTDVEIEVPIWVEAPNRRQLFVGDKVKVIWKDCSLYGQIGTIESVEKNGLYLVGGFNGEHYYGRFKEEDLRLQHVDYEYPVMKH